MLDPYPLTEIGVPRRRDVPGGEDAGHAGLEVLVHLNAVPDLDGRRLGEFRPGDDADTDHDEVGLDDLSAGGADALGCAGADDRFGGGAEVELDAVVGVEPAEHGTHLRAHHLGQGNGAGVDHGHLDAHLSGRGGDFGADPTGSDHDHPAGLADGRGEAVGVADVTEVVDAGKVGAGDRQPSRRRAGGE